MVAKSLHDESLLDLLASLARRSRDGELILAAGVGVGGAIAVAAVFGRDRWVTTALLLAIGAFGAWGLADRELRERRASAPAAQALAIRALRFVFGAAAILTAFVLGARAVSMLIGYWKT